MTANLHQIELSFNPVEDRLLLKIHTTNLQEFRFWLSRRFVVALYDILKKLLATEKTDDTQKQMEKQKVIEHFQDEQARRQPTASKFAHTMSQTPLGPEPLLAVAIIAKPENGIFHLKIDAKTGQTLQMTANRYIVLSLCKLLAETVKKADWNLKFEL